MTYLHFHLVFILPVILVLALLVRRRPSLLPHPFWGIALLCIIAAVYTTPWDQHLIARGVWGYDMGRILEDFRVGLVPIEEFAFFLLLPVMAGLFLLFFSASRPHEVRRLLGPAPRGSTAPICGAAFGLLMFGAGALLLRTAPEVWTYLALILVWAGPVIALQWAVGGGTLWQARGLLVTAVMGPTIYLWVVDMIAIEWGIWIISPTFSTGLKLYSLPIEEAVFFLVTGVMVVQGLALYFAFLARWMAARERP